jgi:hypothetical protein
MHIDLQYIEKLNSRSMPMNEFLLVFQIDYQKQLTPEQIQNHLKNWQEWLISLAVNDILASKLKRWDKKGKVLKRDREVILGPYAESEKSIDDVIVIYATCYEEAKEIARGCPTLALGGVVEIRMAV